jgi:hypothetical protein
LRARAGAAMEELPPELRVLVARMLCVRDLVRLSRVSKQLHALCIDVGERAVREMIAAGEDDAPLPARLSEHVLRRLARLCGVRFMPAEFVDAMLDATLVFRHAFWDVAALEKAYVVLSECELELGHFSTRSIFKGKPWTHGEHYEFWKHQATALIGASITYSDYEQGVFPCVTRKYVDRAINLLYSGGDTMMRSRLLMEQVAYEDDPNDADAEPAIHAKATAVEQKDDELELAREDELGVLIDRDGCALWFPSCEAFFSVSHADLEELVYCKKVKPGVLCRAIYETGYNNKLRVARRRFEGGAPPCSNELCCHTFRNCRLVNFFGFGGISEAHPLDEESLAGITRAPHSGRLRAFDCPRGLEERAHRAEFRKWRRESRKNAKSVLASLGFAVVEGVRLGDAYERSDLPNLLAWSF